MGKTNQQFFEEAAREAAKALCLKDKCGAVVVIDGKIVGRGFNGPPLNDIDRRKCHLNLIESRKPKSDRTCCVHAEERAITSALMGQGQLLSGGTLYFTRVDEAGKILRSGAPYCTLCSRHALDSGLKFFALWHEEGIRLYDTVEYNELSYAFHTQPSGS